MNDNFIRNYLSLFLHNIHIIEINHNVNIVLKCTSHLEREEEEETFIIPTLGKVTGVSVY